MERLEPIDSGVRSYLIKKKFQLDEIEFVVSGDLNPDGGYGTTWIIVTKEKVIALNSVAKTEMNNEGKSSNEWHEYGNYDISELEEVNSENLSYSGMLTVKVNSEYRLISRYTNGHTRKFGMAAKLIKKLKESKTLLEEDFKDLSTEERCPKCGGLYPDYPRKVCPKCMDKRALFFRVMSFLPRYKFGITFILICMLASSALNILNPYLGGNVFFDHVLKSDGKYHGRILEVIFLMVLARFLALIISIMYGRANAGISAEIIYDLKTDVFSAMQRLSLSFYNSKQTGSLMNQVNNDANQLQYFFHDGLPYFIVNSVTMIGIGATMLAVNWQLALCILIPVPIIVYMIKSVFPKLRSLHGKNFRRRSSMNALINDSITGMRVVKAFGKEETEINRFTGANERVRDVNVQLGNTISTTFPIIHFIMGLGGIVIWGAGGWMMVNGNMTFGTLMTFTGYVGMIYGPLQFMTHIVQWWTSCMDAASRIFEILDAVPDITDSSNPVRLKDMQGDVTLKNVTFSYEPNKPVLHDINIDIKAGEMIGLVGHSGAGKSTITNLITRLYDVEEGAILIDGINIKDIALEDLKPQIGMVLQDTYLFMGTIAENIAYARPRASREEIIAAAKAANAHDFIVKLPDGYDTIIGKKGKNLSGGEKQRLSIARAILHNPKILILDEATSSVDTETERMIQEALERLIKGRTTIAIAHRLSTLRNADRLVVMDGGKAVEIGTHSELIKNKGVYYKLVEKQKEALKIQGVAQ